MKGHLEDVMEEMEEAEAEEKRRVERVEKENEEQKRREEQKKVGRVSSRVQANALIEAEKARLEVSHVRTQSCSTYTMHPLYLEWGMPLLMLSWHMVRFTTPRFHLLALAGDRSARA